MYSESAQYYDLIHTSFKDYEEEAETIATLVRKVHPQARTMLDVACGTGEHAHILTTDYGFQVDGLDLNPEFVEIAAHKNPDGHFYVGNMIDFHLGKQYDIVMCLFSAIGYVQTIENVIKTLGCFREHTKPNGIILVEPWFQPHVLITGHVPMVTVEDEDLKICRMVHTEVDGNLSRLTFHYLVGQSEEGVHYRKELHEMGLFTIEEMLHCFQQAGLSADHDPVGLYHRGLYIAKGPD